MRCGSVQSLHIYGLFLLLTVFFLIPATLSGQDEPTENVRFNLFPPGYHFPVLKANIEEPRVGLFQFFDGHTSKLDIGNAVDLLSVEWPHSRTRLTLGIDFMAYGFITTIQGSRLQVDAIDGLYGANISISTRNGLGQLQTRLRYLHHSAHFVDGHYLPEEQRWLNDKNPIPFTRNFGEMTLAHIIPTQLVTIRPYISAAYAVFVWPEFLPRDYYSAGIEVSTDRVFGKLFDKPTNLFWAYHNGMVEAPGKTMSHHTQGGVKLGEWYGKGTTVYVAYYRGKHIFAEYLLDQMNTFAVGFTVDFF